MSLRDRCVGVRGELGELWENARGRIDGQRAETSMERAIVNASRAVLCSVFTVVAIATTLVIDLTR